MIESIGSPLLWAGFTVFIVAMLVLDLGVFHRKAHVVGFREAVTWSVVWVLLALAFNGWIYAAHGTQRGTEFLTGYVIEKALSVDDVFVFLVVFNTFAVPAHLQHRVLFWGVVGALAMRAVLIFTGTAALEAFHGVIYLFGAILLLTGVKLLVTRGREEHPEKNQLFRRFQKLVPTSPEYDGARFFTRMNGKRVATPLFAVHLKAGLALVLIFVALKMLVSDFYKVPVQISLAVVLALLAGATLRSLMAPTGGPALARASSGPGRVVDPR